MDFVEVFNVSLDLPSLLVLVAVEFPLCVAVAPSQNGFNILSVVKLSIL